MLWARVEHAGRIRYGVVEGDHINLQDGDPFSGGNAGADEKTALADVKFLTPCVPTKIVALWNNFHAAATKNNWAIPAEPLYFIKTANAHCAHLEPIPAPTSYDGRVIYEGELGIVIGRQCKAVAVEQAAAHILGYTCVNDVTALELLSRDPAFAQWSRAKNFDKFGAFGPVIATDIDPLTLTVRALVNGRERQNYPVSDMIFKPAELVSLISRDMTLMPGDVIACGTSLGALPMKPGTTIEIAIDGIGTLRNEYV